MHTKPPALRLYRGIAVAAAEADRIIERIRTQGIVGTEGRWVLPLNHNRANTTALMAKADLSTADTRRRADEIPTICACGDEAGAAFYAAEHEASDGSVPLIIEMYVEVDRVWVDGRDFLYPAFQIFDQRSNHNLAGQRSLLEKCFGRAVLPYFDASTARKKPNYRIAMCDLAIEDPDVVMQHSRNRILLQGRYKTRFRSAFGIETPVTPPQIVAVRRTSVPPREKPAVTLEDFLTGDV